MFVRFLAYLFLYHSQDAHTSSFCRITFSFLPPFLALVGGWVQCMMAGAPKLDAVLDCTMGYVYYNQGERPSEKSLMSGRFPREVHIHVERHSIEEFNLPADVRELTREDGGERRTCSAADMEHAKQSLSTWVRVRLRCYMCYVCYAVA